MNPPDLNEPVSADIRRDQTMSMKKPHKEVEFNVNQNIVEIVQEHRDEHVETKKSSVKITEESLKSKASVDFK